jgi:hypothetical protein
LKTSDFESVAEQAREEREGVALVRVAMADLFAKQGTISNKLDNPVKNIQGLEVMVSMATPLMPEQIMRELNPLTISIARATGLPDTPTTHQELKNKLVAFQMQYYYYYICRFVHDKWYCYVSSDVFLCTLATSFLAVAVPTGASPSLTPPSSTSTTFMSSFWAPLTPPSWPSSSGGRPCSLSCTIGTVGSYATPAPPYLVKRVRMLCSEHMLFPEAVGLLAIKKLRSLGIRMGLLASTLADSCSDRK